MFDVIVVGGGAAGFYGAIQMAKANPSLSIAILERGKTVLSKVKISGGGRCNVTQGQFYVDEMIKGYPRGNKELLGPFYTHAPSEVIAFFEEHGVSLKTESDGRVFPKSDSSQTVIDCFMNLTESLGIKVLRNSSVKNLTIKEEGTWQVTTMNKHYLAKKVLLASGSNSRIWQMMQELGHTIVEPVPSLFTLNIKDDRLKGIQGISTNASISVPPKSIFVQPSNLKLKSLPRKEPVLQEEGPVLITHWGLSGPAVLRLSAWGARVLNEYKYNFKVIVNWTPDYTYESMSQYLNEVKEAEGKKTVARTKAVEIPQRLWMSLVNAAEIPKTLRWAETNKKQILALAEQLTQSSFRVEGKSTFKEEFVTAGGVDLKEVDFRTFASKKLPNLYFAGEVLNIDGITGGYNFQNAWTGAYIAAQAIAC